ncbi:MAG TPA: glycosyltransferase family 9 protein [Bacteroidales bacterium]
MRFLIIQTASIGDVILATPIIEKLHRFFPGSKIDFLLKAGNESLFSGHPFLNRVIIWDKKEAKYSKFIGILKDIRTEPYDRIINLQRFGATGLLTCLSNAHYTVGFDKNPFSRLFTLRIKHQIGNVETPPHEIERNLSLISTFTDTSVVKPCLYPSGDDRQAVESYKQTSYFCIAPASLWFTKQYPADAWADFLDKANRTFAVYLLGSDSDTGLCDYIISKSGNTQAVNLAGKLTLLQTAALMQDAMMNFVNDSAPMHLASAVNAPVTAIYCSTVPSFGFGPLSINSNIVETETPLSCKPCGLHGFQACPEKHFRCATTIKTEQLLFNLPYDKV